MAGRLIIISAPSGTGKSTVAKDLLERQTSLRRTVSCTTRKPRSGEVDGKDYIFVDHAEFKKRIGDGYFVEWVETFGNLYGTPKDQIESALRDGADIILVIEVIGGTKMRKMYSENSISIFLLPPNEEALRQRLVGRNTDSPESIEDRFENARKEMAHASEYDYKVVNDDLNSAVEEIISIIDKKSD